MRLYNTYYNTYLSYLLNLALIESNFAFIYFKWQLIESHIVPILSFNDISFSICQPRDNFGFITYRYTCDALAALENGHTLCRSNEPHFELCLGGQKQYSKSNYTDLGKYKGVCIPTQLTRDTTDKNQHLNAELIHLNTLLV